MSSRHQDIYEYMEQHPTARRARTESGDYYLASQEDWQSYREAVRRGDWDIVQAFEEGGGSFRYDPE